MVEKNILSKIYLGLGEGWVCKGSTQVSLVALKNNTPIYIPKKLKGKLKF